MARVAAVLPGYATVKHAAEVLHLAPRSVRDLIYTGRLPSVRLGRPHFVRAADLDVERRRRLGLSLPASRPRSPRARTAARPVHDASEAPAASRPTDALAPQAVEASRRPAAEHRQVDSALRRQRAAERAALVSHWAERHAATSPGVPFMVRIASAPVRCEICGREIRSGRRMVMALPDDAPLCVPCGRRGLLDWADRRRLEAAAARRMAQDLDVSPELVPAAQRVA